MKDAEIHIKNMMTKEILKRSIRQSDRKRSETPSKSDSSLIGLLEISIFVFFLFGSAFTEFSEMFISVSHGGKDKGEGDENQGKN
jgi:hypothetical protein